MGSVVPTEINCGYALPLEEPIGSKEVVPDVAHEVGVGGSRRIRSFRVGAHVIELEHLFEGLNLTLFVPHDDKDKIKQLFAPTDILIDKVSVHDSLVGVQPFFD